MPNGTPLYVKVCGRTVAADNLKAYKDINVSCSFWTTAGARAMAVASVVMHERHAA
jgi:hypothetical protein